MFYNLILQLLMMLGLGIAVYIIGSMVPRIDDEPIVHHKKHWQWEELMKRLPLKKLDESLDSFFEKTLRKLKIILMKADNSVTNKLNGFKGDGSKKNGNGLGTS